METNLEHCKKLNYGNAKGYRTNINIKNQKIGPERRQEILDNISDKGTFLPRCFGRRYGPNFC
jgi:hypothetical protein